MSSQHTILFHSLLSPYLNLGLLRPLELIRGAEAAYEDEKAPINSVEGFIRQILGWREFMFWQYWRLMPELYENNFWNARRPLPSFFWDGQTDLNCLRQVLRRALDSGYNHHIERLMILANFSLLTGLDPIAVNEWFLSMYVDAYDWAMAPNVIGMGLHADGGLIASKPYIASANYINKMSNYCPSCAFDRNQRSGEKACPFNFLYWNFLIEKEEVLRANPRLGPNVLGLRHLDQAEREKVQKDARSFLETISNA
jgi:deoxyribodipyrimidine photolyase-related protein